MPKVQHPAFPEIINEIPRSALDAHLAAGWLHVVGFNGKPNLFVPVEKAKRK